MRVTIGELVEDFIPHTEKGNKITQVEIVPREIVNQIIYYCESNATLSESAERLIKVLYGDDRV